VRVLLLCQSRYRTQNSNLILTQMERDTRSFSHETDTLSLQQNPYEKCPTQFSTTGQKCFHGRVSSSNTIC